MSGRKGLYVEGKDEEHVIKHMCEIHGIGRLEPIVTREGVVDLLSAFEKEVPLFNREGDTLGIVVDADTNVDARWQAIRNRLLDLGYVAVPNRPQPDGAILDPPQNTLLPRVGVWLMPDNLNAGKLENLLKQMVPASDVLIDHARVVVSSLPLSNFTVNDKIKAVMHTWLAWQVEPGRPYGTAITAGYFDAHAPAAEKLVSWLHRLYNP